MKLSLLELQGLIARIYVGADFWEDAELKVRLTNHSPFRIDPISLEIEAPGPETFRKELDEKVRGHLKKMGERVPDGLEKAYFIMRLIEDLALVGVRELQR